MKIARLFLGSIIGVLCTFAAASDETDKHIFNFDVQTTHPGSFIKAVAFSREAANVRSKVSTQENPFIIVYESNRMEWEIPEFIPKGEPVVAVPSNSNTFYKTRGNVDNLTSALLEPLTAADSKLTASLVKNVLLVREHQPQVPNNDRLSRPVIECTTSALTFSGAYSLLTEKYGWEDAPPISTFAHNPDEIIINSGPKPCTVRTLLLKFLQAAAKAKYMNSNESWIAAFQIKLPTYETEQDLFLVLFLAWPPGVA